MQTGPGSGSNCRENYGGGVGYGAFQCQIQKPACTGELSKGPASLFHQVNRRTNPGSRSAEKAPPPGLCPRTQANTDRLALAVFRTSLIVVHDAELSDTVRVQGRGARVRAVGVQGSLGFHTRVFARFCL